MAKLDAQITLCFLDKLDRIDAIWKVFCEFPEYTFIEVSTRVDKLYEVFVK